MGALYGPSNEVRYSISNPSESEISGIFRASSSTAIATSFRLVYLFNFLVYDAGNRNVVEGVTGGTP